MRRALLLIASGAVAAALFPVVFAGASGTAVVRPLQGGIHCSVTGGKIVFHSALRASAVIGKDSFMHVNFSLGSCSRPVARTGHSVMANPYNLRSDSCTKLSPPRPIDGHIRWAPGAVFTNFQFSESSSRTELEGPPVSFRYRGGDTDSPNGRPVSALLTTSLTEAQIHAACRSSHGLSSIAVTGGFFRVK
jgi:hypothetical protein